MKKLAVLLVIISATFLQAETINGLKWEYEIRGESAIAQYVSTTNGTKVAGAITIPSYLGGHPVTGFTSGVCNSNTCRPEDITSVTIPYGVTSIPSRAFDFCSNLVSVAVPDSVTHIGEQAFRNCTSLQTSPIGNGVTSIGSGAFSGCTGLTSVTIPPSVSTIGSYAFSGCNRLTSVHISDLSAWCKIRFGSSYYWLIDASITANPLHCARRLFLNGHEVTNLAIPDKETALDHFAFVNCTNLTSVIVPNSVESMGEGVFAGCSGLKTMSIPFLKTERDDNKSFFPFGGLFGQTDAEGTVPVGQRENDSSNASRYTFYIPENLVSVTITGDTTLHTDAFRDCWMLKDIHINEGVTSIEKCAFMGSGITNLTVALPASVTSLGTYAFADCPGLQSLPITDGVTSIGEYAFRNCVNAKTVTIPQSVTSFGDYAFENCTALTSVKIPNSVENIGSYSFVGCASLQSITLPSARTRTSSYYGSSYSTFGGLFSRSESDGTTEVRQRGDTFYIPTNIVSVTITDETSIPQDAFRDCWMLKDIRINEGVTSIGQYAFANCTGLTSFTLPMSVTSIGQYAFQNCTGLEAFHIPSNNISLSINSTAFDGCPAGLFDTVTKPGLALLDGCVVAVDSTVSGIVDLTGTRGPTQNAFSGNRKITGVILPEGMSVVPANAFNGCTALASVTIPSSVRTIGADAFRGCSKLTGIVIPEGVAAIGERAFQNCTALRGVAMPSTMQSVGIDAFGGDSNIATVTITDEVAWSGIAFGNAAANPAYFAHALTKNGESVRSLVVPEGARRIGAWTFCANEELSVVSIPASVTDIGVMAFLDCPKLPRIEIAADNPSYRSIGGIVFTKDRRTLLRAPAGWFGNANLTESVRNIGPYAFSGCAGLLAISIPNSVTNIGTHAFDGCSALTEVVVPESVASVGWDIFSGCRNLQALTLPFVGTERGNDGAATAQLGCLFGWIWKDPAGSRIVRQYYDDYHYCDYQIPTNLASVVVTDETTVGSGAFENCAMLATIQFNAGVTNIGARAFCGSGVTGMSVPASVTSIGEKAFLDCPALGRIDVDAANPSYRSVGGILFTKDRKTLLRAPGGWYGNAVIPEGVTAIVPGAFEGCRRMFGVTVPNTVTSLATGTFHGCAALQSMTLPFVGIERGTPDIDFQFGALFVGGAVDGTTPVRQHYLKDNDSTIGTYHISTNLVSVTITDETEISPRAFENCAMLTAIQFNAGVTNIGACAFSGSGVTSMSVPASVTTIEAKAFLGCQNLSRIDVDADNPAYRSIGGILFTKDRRTLLRAPGAWYGVANVSENVRAIAPGAFEGCWQLLGVSIPGNMTTIAERSFAGCTALVGLTMQGDAIPEDAEHVGADAFAGVPATMVIWVQPEASGWGSTWQGFEVCVIKSETSTTPVPVPHSFLDTDYPSILAVHGGDYEEAAKATAANGVNKVWECYVAGISPTNAAARFEATIEMGADGKPVVTWTPDLNEGGKKSERVYRVLGAKELGAAAQWDDVTDVEDPDAEGYRFFKAAVEMP